MELRHLHHFVVLAEELSFKSAAKRLHLSQPPLSVQIKRLEEELGVRLFDRSSRGIKLTAEGRVFLEHARTVLAAAEAAKRSAQHAHEGMVGDLRIGIILPALTVSLSENFRNFRSKYPGVRLFIYHQATAEQLLRLQTDQLDAGLMRPPLGWPGLKTMLIREDQLSLAVPCGHRFLDCSRIQWEDLKDEPMVMLQPEMQFGLYDDFTHECAKRGFHPLVSQYANNADTLFWLVSAGLGISLLPNLGHQPPGVEFCRPPAGLRTMQEMLVWKQSNQSPVLANFLKCFVNKSP